MKTRDKFFGLLGVFWGIVYLIWLLFSVHRPLGYLLMAADTMFISLAALYLFNHWSQKHLKEAALPAEGTLDVFLPVVNEPISLFEETIKAAANIDYDLKKIYILDDGGREHIRALATKYGVEYLSRCSSKDFKAGNLNHGIEHSKGDFILVLDADQVVQPNIAKELLGHFQTDPKVAVVATRQTFELPEGDFNHDLLFFGQALPGKNADNAAISCGSGVFYRRSALAKIGNFQTWNLVEDLYTSYILHLHGFVTLYINKSYTLGFAPLDLPTIYKQRGTWGLDTLRIFFRHNPLFQKSLTFRQKCHYFEMGWMYIVSALALPIVFILLPISLTTNTDFIPANEVYLSLRFPALYFTVYFFYLQSGNSLSVNQFWISLFPVYLRGLFLALLPHRPVYRVTKKTGGDQGRYLSLIMPHLVLIVLNGAALIWQITNFGFTDLSVSGLIWFIFMLNWFVPIVRRGLGVDPAVRNTVPAATSP